MPFPIPSHGYLSTFAEFNDIFLFFYYLWHHEINSGSTRPFVILSTERRVNEMKWILENEINDF